MESALRHGSGSGVMRVNSEDQSANSSHRFLMIDNRQCPQPLPPPPAAAVAAENKRSSQSTPRQNTHASLSSIATHASLPNPNCVSGGAAGGEAWPSTVEQWLHSGHELRLSARERPGRCEHEQCYGCGEGDEDEEEDDEDEEAEPHQQCHYNSHARCRNTRCRNSRCRQHTYIERRRHRGERQWCLHCAHCGAHSDPNVCERCSANDSAALSRCGTCNSRTLAHGLESVSVSNSSPGASTSAAANANSASAREPYQQLSLSPEQQLQQQLQLQSMQNSQQCFFQFPANYMAAPQSAQLPVQAPYYPSIGGTANCLPYAAAGAQNALYSSGSMYASFGTDPSQLPVLLPAAQQQQQQQQQQLQQQQTLADTCPQGAQPVLYSSQDVQNALYMSAGVGQPQLYYTSSGQPLVFVPLGNAQVAPLSATAPAAQLAAAVVPVVPTGAAAAPVAGVASAAGVALAAAAAGGASSSSNDLEPLSCEQRILLENVLSSTTQPAASAPGEDVNGGRGRGLGAAADSASANPVANPGAQMPKPLSPERTLCPQPVVANQAVATSPNPNPNVARKPSAGKANDAAGAEPATPKDTAPRTGGSNAQQPLQLPEVSRLQLQFSPCARLRRKCTRIVEEAARSIIADFSLMPEHRALVREHSINGPQYSEGYCAAADRSRVSSRGSARD